MTLILTEISSAGVAMAADSAITWFRPDGSIAQKDRSYWTKLIHVPRLNAGISYWGAIGKVVARRFDEWLEARVRYGAYTNLQELADYLTQELNAACGNVPLAAGCELGLHVAGYHEWADQQRRPTFFHIHNGHGYINFAGMIKLAPRLVGNQAVPHYVPTNPTWVWQQPRTLFTAHMDFPKANCSFAENVTGLAGGYLTRNGDIGHYTLIAEGLYDAALSVNHIPGVRMPSDPDDIRPRLNFLVMQVQTTAAFYRCSNLSRIIGGTISGLGLRADGTTTQMHRSASCT